MLIALWVQAILAALSDGGSVSVHDIEASLPPLAQIN